MISNGVMFGDKHSYNDFDLIMTDKQISAPVPQTKLIEIPGRNGSVDISTVVSGNVRYDNRTITMNFYSPQKVDDWPMIISNLQNYLSGTKLQIVFDDDKAFYWLGRVMDVLLKASGPNAYINITATVDPYKYNITTSAEDWLWDTFDFEQSVINELYDIQVEGERTIDIVGIKKYENPIIISDAIMTVEHNGAAYQIAEGSQVMYDITLTKETETLTFKGNGTISINYTGGSL